MSNKHWYLKVGSEPVSFDPNSGGYPYRGEGVIPRFFQVEEYAKEMLTHLVEMKLLPADTQICFVEF